jgi:ribosome-associated protein
VKGSFVPPTPCEYNRFVSSRESGCSEGNLPAESLGRIGEVRELEPLELARRVVDLVVDKMGSDVILMQIGELSLIADYFVICTGETERQLDAIRYELQRQLKTEGEYPVGTEGTPASGWVLMDYGSVVVHIFAPSQRERYQLERLWSDAKIVVRVA